VNWHLRPARADEAQLLSELALRSKAVWGYDEAFLQACRAELRVMPADISHADWLCIVATSKKPLEQHLVGFYLLSSTSTPGAELDALFVEPGNLGQGVGRRLLEHALDVLRLHRIRSLTIQSDPGAVGFYERMGAQRVGERPSGSIAGRVLPVLQILV